jgi:IS30 family transposase
MLSLLYLLPKAIEFDCNGIRRTNMFYCDSSAPNQKGSCEVNHEFIRRILPKGSSFDNLTQAGITLMMNHSTGYHTH